MRGRRGGGIGGGGESADQRWYLTGISAEHMPKTTAHMPEEAALTRSSLAEEEEVLEVGRHPLSHNERMAHRQTTGYTHDKTTNCW